MSNGLFNPSLDSPIVRIYPTEDRLQYRIVWPAQSGADGYRVYGGFDPLYVRSLISGQYDLPATQTEFIFNAPFYPPGQIVYFWVAAVEGGAPRFLDEYGSYTLRTDQASKFDDFSRFSDTTEALMALGDQKYYMEEIRRRAKAIQEDVAEEVYLFIKQWRGLPDPTAQDQLGLDPNYQAMTRGDKSSSTGFYPGFFPSIPILMRFGGLPTSQLDFQLPGLRPLLSNESWTIWDPIMHEGDMVVRKTTGQRYVATSVAFGNYRGVPIDQRIALDIISPTSPLQKINDTNMKERWKSVNSADFMRAGFGIACSEDTGGPDYMLFGFGG